MIITFKFCVDLFQDDYWSGTDEEDERWLSQVNFIKNVSISH